MILVASVSTSVSYARPLSAGHEEVVAEGGFA